MKRLILSNIIAILKECKMTINHIDTSKLKVYIVTCRYHYDMWVCTNILTVTFLVVLLWNAYLLWYIYIYLYQSKYIYVCIYAIKWLGNLISCKDIFDSPWIWSI